MRRLLALFSSAILLGGCVAAPYDTDSVYYPTYPATVNAQVSSGYYYPERAYPYTPAPYGSPYPSYPTYPYYQPPAYTPPAPVIVPPSIEFNYNRNVRPGWQHHPEPRHDAFRNGPRPEWNRPGSPGLQWQRHDDERPEWQHRDWQHRDWHQRDGDRSEWQGGRREQWQHGGSRGNFRQR